MVLTALLAGMISGLAAAVLGYAAAGLPLWMSVLLYPAVGSAGVVLAAGMLAWRRNSPGMPCAATASHGPLAWAADTGCRAQGLRGADCCQESRALFL